MRHSVAEIAREFFPESALEKAVTLDMSLVKDDSYSPDQLREYAKTCGALVWHLEAEKYDDACFHPNRSKPDSRIPIFQVHGFKLLFYFKDKRAPESERDERMDCALVFNPISDVPFNGVRRILAYRYAGISPGDPVYKLQ